MCIQKKKTLVVHGTRASSASKAAAIECKQSWFQLQTASLLRAQYTSIPGRLHIQKFWGVE